MMDPRNPVFDAAPSQVFKPTDLPTMPPGYLTPSPAADDDHMGIGGTESKDHGLDPDILVSYPLPAMSPIVSDDEGSKWDWDDELDSLKS